MYYTNTETPRSFRRGPCEALILVLSQETDAFGEEEMEGCTGGGFCESAL